MASNKLPSESSICCSFEQVGAQRAPAPATATAAAAASNAYQRINVQDPALLALNQAQLLSVDGLCQHALDDTSQLEIERLAATTFELGCSAWAATSDGGSERERESQTRTPSPARCAALVGWLIGWLTQTSVPLDRALYDAEMRSCGGRLANLGLDADQHVSASEAHDSRAVGGVERADALCEAACVEARTTVSAAVVAHTALDELPLGSRDAKHRGEEDAHERASEQEKATNERREEEPEGFERLSLSRSFACSLVLVRHSFAWLLSVSRVPRLFLIFFSWCEREERERERDRRLLVL